MPLPRKPAIALLSSRTLFRQGLAALLTDQRLAPILEIEDLAKLLTGAQRRPIDIAIIDLDHGQDVMTIVQTLRQDLPELQLVVLGMPIRAPAVVTDGAEAPEVDREALVSSLVHGFRAATSDNPPHRNWSRITARQRDVMRWLAMGLDNAAIGQKLRIGERAVKAHISSLLALFTLENRTQLALLADRAGLRPPTRR